MAIQMMVRIIIRLLNLNKIMKMMRRRWRRITIITRVG